MNKTFCKVISLLLAFVITTSFTITAQAKEKTVTKTITKTMTGKEYSSYKPEAQITDEKGNVYYLQKTDVSGDEVTTFQIVTKDLKNKKVTIPKTAINPNNSTQVGRLDNFEYEDKSNDKRTKSVTKSVTKKKIIFGTSPNMKKTISTDYLDKETGKKVKANLNLKGTQNSNDYWISSEPIKGTVTQYDADTYKFTANGDEIKKNQTAPLYKGYEKQILQYAKLNKQSYKITGSKWVGQAYKSSSGVICRNLEFTAQVKVYDCTGEYQNIVNLPKVERYNAIATYSTSDTREVKLTMTYQLTQKDNTAKIIVCVALGLFLLAALVVAIMYVISKKKKGGKQNV